MKTIEEAASNYIDNCIEVENDECAWQTVDEAFKAGVEFAQQWILVNDELPSQSDGCVLVKLDDGSVSTSFILSSGDFAYNIKPTHWRPIERK